jgi:hypothetical protein
MDKRSPRMSSLLYRICILPLDLVKVSALAATEFLTIYFAGGNGMPVACLMHHDACMDMDSSMILPFCPREQTRSPSVEYAKFLTIYFCYLFSTMFRASLRLFQVTKTTTGIFGLHGIPVL